jgi:type IV secretory pathway VirB9-like protein
MFNFPNSAVIVDWGLSHQNNEQRHLLLEALEINSAETLSLITVSSALSVYVKSTVQTSVKQAKHISGRVFGHEIQ